MRNLTYLKTRYPQTPVVTTQRYYNLLLKLLPLIGNAVTVFVDSGGISGSGFTGILIEVSPDSIQLITQVPSAPTMGQHHKRNILHKSNRKRKQGNKLGAYTIILLEHITAITYSYI
jgi:hypothetical protein